LTSWLNQIIKPNTQMSEKEKINTEEKILEAAKDVFVENGLSGARMQEIANKAGINKSLLHYYYRSKEKLFGTVFKFIFSKLSVKIFDIFESEDDFFTKLEKFVENYLNLLIKNPIIPMFILNELNKKGENTAVAILKSAGININKFEIMVQQEIEAGTIKESTDPKKLIINILGLCIFPIIGRPLTQEIVFNGDKAGYDKYLSQRKDEIIEIIKLTLTK